jgi:hypothetical protein
MRVLEFMGKRRAKLLANGNLPDPARTGLFTTAIVSITGEGPIALFLTGRKHAGENLADVLAARSKDLVPPIQMCDALDRNQPKGHAVIESNCLSHGRRHIVDEAENFPSECRHVLEELSVVFANEALCKEKGWRGEELFNKLFMPHDNDPLCVSSSWTSATNLRSTCPSDRVNTGTDLKA